MDEKDSAPLRVMHHVHLRDGGWGGVERHFAAFLESAATGSALRNYVAENLRGVSAEMAEALRWLAAPAVDLRRWHGVPVPKAGGLRNAWQRRLARAWRVDRVLSWNMMGDTGPARTAHRAGVPAIYWERGSAWFTDESHVQAGFHEAYDLYLANSSASRAMLQQRWNVRAPVKICSPGVPLTFHQPGRLPRRLPKDRPLRVGFAGRLKAFKGGVLAVHALAELLALGWEAELWVAGAGPDAEPMRRASERTGTSASLEMLGKQSDMPAFFEAIDVYLHPALHEAYGLVCAEALTAGVPVVVAGVDGLPEVMADGIDGLCVPATLSLRDFEQLGGDASGVDPLAFDPSTGVIGPPKAAAPAALARAIADVVSDDAEYRRFSAGALAAYDSRFHFDKHMVHLTALLREARRSS